MAILKLPGGTDIAEMALFEVGAMPLTYPKKPDKAFDELERAGKMMRFPTGADGGYLLHAYIDEAMPDVIRSGCLLEDELEGELKITDRRIAFGGLESCTQDFGSNKHIRTDATVEPGRYRVKAYRTEIPDETLESELAAVMKEFSPMDQFLRSVPRWWVGFSIVSTFGCLIFQKHAAAVVVSLVGAVVHRWLGNLDGLRRIRMRIDECRLSVELQYPSIVVEMRSEPGPGHQPK